MELISKGRVRLTCGNCKKAFETYLSVAKRGPIHACSLSCARALFPSKKRERTNMECEVCGGAFEVVKGRSGDGRKPKARFCSIACKNRKLRGSGHPLYIDGRTRDRAQFRKVMNKRVREEGRCQECGATGYLHAHHIKPYATHPELRGEPSNIIVLCPPCHANKHPNQASHLFKGIPRSGETRNCPVCGRDFYVKPSHSGTRKTCSHSCGVKQRVQPKRSSPPS